MPTAPTPNFTRPALSPGILAALVMFVGFALLDSDAYLFIRFGVCILTVIVAVFAWQAGARQSRAWLWLVGLVPIAIIWNPAWVIELNGQGWVVLQFVAALILILAGVFIKVPRTEA